MSRTEELVLALAGIATSAAMVAAIPWVVRGLPTDHFVRPQKVRPLWLKLAQNVVGFGLMVLGVLLLFLPGQGVLTILLGVSILDLPLKHRLVAWLLRREPIRDGLQRMRGRLGRPPLLLPPRDARAPATS